MNKLSLFAISQWSRQDLAKESRCSGGKYDRLKLGGHSMGGSAATLATMFMFLADDVAEEVLFAE